MVASLLDLGLESVDGISVLRGMRLVMMMMMVVTMMVVTMMVVMMMVVTMMVGWWYDHEHRYNYFK